jgi:hypothetical protein
VKYGWIYIIIKQTQNDNLLVIRPVRYCTTVRDYSPEQSPPSSTVAQHDRKMHPIVYVVQTENALTFLPCWLPRNA